MAMEKSSRQRNSTVSIRSGNQRLLQTRMTAF
jgi:hypothetical protein